MPSPFAGPNIDFSALSGIGETIGSGIRQNRLGNVLAGGIPRGPDGSYDYGAMADAFAKAGFPKEAMAIVQSQSEQGLSPYEAARLAQSERALKMRENPRPTAAELKHRYAAEDDVNSYTSAIANLDEAAKLVGEGIYEGGLAPAQAELGANWNYGGVLDEVMDTGKARRTQQYQNIMGPAAMERMAQELKGSTAYQELLTYQQMFANPRLPKETKIAQLRRLKAAIQRHVATKAARVKELSGASGGGEETPELAPGVIVDGYTYNGGDPNDPSSWDAP